MSKIKENLNYNALYFKFRKIHKIRKDFNVKNLNNFNIILFLKLFYFKFKLLFSFFSER